MAAIASIIVVYDTFSIPTANILKATVNDQKVSLTLKELAVDNTIGHIFDIQAPSADVANKFHALVSDIMRRNDIGFILLNGEKIPRYEIEALLNEFTEGLLVIDGHKIWASNIGAITFDSDNNLTILLRHKMSLPNDINATYFRIHFNSFEDRHQFHNKVIAAIYYGSKLSYNG